MSKKPIEFEVAKGTKELLLCIAELKKKNAELEKDKAYTEGQLDEQIQATLKLQKENAELKAKIYGGGYDAVIAKKDADIILLEKQNSELKARLNAINLLTPELQKASKLRRQQLTKAKELLNEFMRISKASDEDFEHDYSELIAEAEQFISEVEN